MKYERKNSEREARDKKMIALSAVRIASPSIQDCIPVLMGWHTPVAWLMQLLEEILHNMLSAAAYRSNSTPYCSGGLPNNMYAQLAVSCPLAIHSKGIIQNHCKPNTFFEFSYTMYDMLMAGATFSKFGVTPLNRPRNPSFLIVLLVTSIIPVYVGLCKTVP